MKTRPILSLLTVLALNAGFAVHSQGAARIIDNVAVVFQEPDNFTDVRDRHSNLNSTANLDELHDYVQQVASPLIPAGSKLTVTFLDIDLAGMIRPDKDNVRVMTGVTPPRAHVKFQLIGADGKVIKEGERKLIDLDYQQNIRLQNRNDPLGHDKQLLKDWIDQEFKKVS